MYRRWKKKKVISVSKMRAKVAAQLSFFVIHQTTIKTKLDSFCWVTVIALAAKANKKWTQKAVVDEEKKK